MNELIAATTNLQLQRNLLKDQFHIFFCLFVCFANIWSPDVIRLVRNSLDITALTLGSPSSLSFITQQLCYEPSLCIAHAVSPKVTATHTHTHLVRIMWRHELKPGRELKMTVSGLRFYRCVKRRTSWNWSAHVCLVFLWLCASSPFSGETQNLSSISFLRLSLHHTHSKTTLLLLWTPLCHTLVNKIKHLNHWGKQEVYRPHSECVHRMSSAWTAPLCVYRIAQLTSWRP